MAEDEKRVSRYLQHLLQEHSLEEMDARLAPSLEAMPPRVPGRAELTRKSIEARWALLAGRPAGPPLSDQARADLLDPWSQEHAADFAHSIEHFIGTAKMPVGLAGPLRVRGLFAHGDYYLPLATTEATLVASYTRGSLAITEAGGCTAMLINEGISRAPGFAFRDLRQAGLFIQWLTENMPALKQAAEGTTRHGHLVDERITLEGNHVYVNFEFETGDASGQNMVTIATDAICAHIAEHCPIRPERAYVEANLSGDKKASAQAFLRVRGRKVTAEVVIPQQLAVQRLHATPRQMADYWQMSALGSVLSGTLGAQGHYANGLAALYIACGQDAACVAESAVGLTRFEVRPEGTLYACVTLPNIVVGTVGGGTRLPTQQACLDIVGLAGAGGARAFAEVCAGLALAGELSIIAALASGEFTHAHQRLARGKATASPGGPATPPPGPTGPAS